MKLTIKHLGQVITDIQLEEGREYFGGRQKDCDFILEDETLSRKHIRIYQSDETRNWIIESVSEKKGLYSEGKSIDKLEIENSVSVFLNNHTFEFFGEEQEKEEASEDLSLMPEMKQEEEISSLLKEDKDTLGGSTKILPASTFIYSLHISIEGESSDHVALNEGETWTLGRSEDCDIYIDYNILSREHLKFSKTGDTFTVTDLGSSNGSILNDTEMQANKTYTLNANDHIVVGDLNIVFEVRNKDFENIMSNLPALTEEEQPSTKVAFPKIVLEEASEENEPSKSTNFFNKKRIIMFSGVGLLLIGLLFLELKREKKPKKEDIEQIEKANLIKETYNLAVQFLQQQKFQFCIDELNKLHQLTSHYLDSKQVLTQCQNSSENQKRYEELLEKERKKKEIEKKVQTLVDECEKQFKAGTIQTVDDLYSCAGEVFELDPSNARIHSMKLAIEEKEVSLRLEEEKKENYRKNIQSKRYLYNKAKKIDKQKFPLKAVAAYKVFIRSARGVSALSSLSKKAEKEMNEIQANYDSALNSLYKGCEDLIEQKKMKDAYYKCKAILKFKKGDEKAIKYMKLAKTTIRNNLKDIYAKSVFEENISNIEQAQSLWKKILEEDIKDGYYYKKANILLNKYK